MCVRERGRELKSDRSNNVTNEFVNLNLSLRLKKFEACVILGLKTYGLDLWLKSVSFRDFYLIFPYYIYIYIYICIYV